MSAKDVRSEAGDPIAEQIASTAKQARKEFQEDTVHRQRAVQESNDQKNRSLGIIAGGLLILALGMTVFNLVWRSREAPTLSSVDQEAAAESLLAAQVTWVEAYRDENGSLPNDLGESMLPEKDRAWEFEAKGDQFTVSFEGEDQNYTFDSGRDSVEELGRTEG